MKEVSILSSLILYRKDVLQVKKSSPDFSIGKNNNRFQNYTPTRRKKKIFNISTLLQMYCELVGLKSGH